MLSNNLSQDLQKLQQEALIAEQKAQHKNAEVRAAQKELDTLHLQIDRKTKRLLDEQVETIQSAKKSLSDGIEEQNAVLTEIVQTIADVNAAKCQVEDELDTLKSDVSDATRGLIAAEEQHTALKASARILSTDIDRLKAEKLALEQQNSELTSVRPLLEDEIATLQARIVEQKHADDKTIEVYESEIVKKQEEVRLLDAQLLKIRQEAEKIQKDEALVRDSLATWQKSLEERDRNLRVRELKVEQGEDKIIRNSSLLNL